MNFRFPTTRLNAVIQSLFVICLLLVSNERGNSQDTRPTATVTSFERSVGNPNRTEPYWQIRFSTPVSGLRPDHFTLTSTGLGGIVEVEGVGPPSAEEVSDVWNISANAGTGSGTIDITLDRDDGMSHAIPGKPAAGPRFDIDRQAPSVLSITRQNPATATTSSNALTFLVTFSEPVENVTTGPQFRVTGGTTATVGHVAEVSPTAYDVTVSGGDLALFNGTVGLNLATGQTITDIPGNPLPTTEPPIDETYTLVNAVVADYAVTTTPTSITVTDVAGISGTLLIEETGGGIRFAASSQTFSVNGGPLIIGNSGNLSLSGITSVNVNAGEGTNGIWMTGAFTGFPNLNINGGSGNDQFLMYQAVVFAPDAGLTVDFQDDAAAPGYDSFVMQGFADLTFSGTGSALIRCSGLFFNVGGGIQTENGSVTIETNQQAQSIADNFSGITLAGTIEATGTGQITLRGRGGVTSAGNNVRGVWIYPTGRVIGGTTGEVIVEGRGGASQTQNTASGIYLQGQITSNGAMVRVTGQGGGAGAAGLTHGIEIPAAGSISSGAGGAVFVEGTGGVSTGFSLYGVQLAGTITSGGGPVSVVGTGGANSGGSGIGVGLNVSGARITSGGNAPITVTGTGRGNGAASYGIQLISGTLITGTGGTVALDANSVVTGAAGLAHQGAITNVGSGSVAISSDRISMSAGTINATSVLLQPRTAGLEIGLGSFDTDTSLGLADTELDLITTATLGIGNNLTGPIRVSGVVSPANAGVLEITTGDTLTSAPNSNIIAGALAVRAGRGIGGSGEPLLTRVPEMAALTGVSSISVSNIGGLRTSSVNGLDGVTAGAGMISLISTGEMQVIGPVRSSGNLTLRTTTAGSDLVVGAGNDGVSSSTGTIAVVAARDIILGTPQDTGDLTSGTGTVLGSGRDIIQDYDTHVRSGGPISATAPRDFKILDSLGGGGLLEATNLSPISISAANSIVIATRNSVEATDADIELTTNLLEIVDSTTFQPGSVASGTGSTLIRPFTAGRPVFIGGTAANTLALPDATLDLISARGLVIGSSSSGPIAVSGPITRQAATNVTLVSGGDISIFQPINTGGGTLGFQPGATIGAVKPVGANALLTASSVNTAGRLSLGIAGPVAAVTHDLLQVAGSVNLTGTTLVLTGGYVPQPTDAIRLVDNDGADGVTGNFTGLLEGAQVSLNGVPMVVSYSGGDGNDVVLTIANSAPTDILLENTDLAENAGVNAVVGTLSTTDSDENETFTYSLVAGAGDTDNAAFNISGATLRKNTSANFETKSSYTVRISSTDGSGSSFSKAFTISITDINEVPVISAVAAQSTNEDTATGQIAFSISDEDDDAGLTLSAASQNEDLIPESAITFGGSGGNRWVVITPVTNQSGSSEITVTASDGTLTASRNFTLTVNPVNDAPTLAAITNPATLPLSSGAQTVNLSGISAGPDANQSVAVTATSDNPSLIPNPAVTHTDPSTTGSLSFTPVTGQSGTATITVTATDDGGTANGGVDSFKRTFIVTVINDADLAITVTDGAATSVAGNPTTYTISVTNNGPSPVFNATVTDTFPAALQSVRWTAAVAGGATAAGAGSGNINETVSLPVGATVTYTVSATIDAEATGSLSNTATVSAAATDPFPGNNSATDTNTLTQAADLAIVMDDGVTSADAGTTVIYTIVASNNGPGSVTGATVADPFPASLQSVTWTAVAVGGATGTLSGTGDLNETVDLPPGASMTYTVEATIDPAATGLLTNTATISSPVTDPVPGNNSATDTDMLTVRSDLAITVSGPSGEVDAGADFYYTIVVTNNGPSEATAVAFADTPPAGLTFVSLDVPPGWTSTTPAVGSSGAVTASIATLAPGVPSTSVLRVKADYLGNGKQLENVASVSSDSTDPVTADNTDSAAITISAIPEIAVFDGPSDLSPPLADGQASVVDFGDTTAWAPLTRSFTVKNTGTGPLELDAVMVPTGFSLVAPFAPQSLAPEASLTFSVRYDAGAVGTATGSVTIASNDADENPFGYPVSGTRLNIAPVAAAQSLVLDEDVPAAITLTGTDGDDDALAFSIVTPPANGSLSGTPPALTYTPDENYNGPDSFTFRVNDGTADSPAASVSLTVNAVNDPPAVVGTGIGDIRQTAPGQESVVNIEDHFTDVETLPSAMIYTVTVAEGLGVVSIIRIDNSLAITGTSPGTRTVTITATDAASATVQDTFTVTVKSVPQVAGGGIPDTLLSPSQPSLDIDLSGYFTDEDGDTLGFSIAGNSDPSKATATLSGSTLTLAPQSPGTTTLNVRATDTDGNSVDDSFTVTVDDPLPTLSPTAGFTPAINRQTGLYEISITATNNNQFDVPGFRLRVTAGLTGDIRLHNSTSPAGAYEPYLDVLAALGSGQEITTVLEFSSPTRAFDGFAPTIVAEPLPTDVTDSGTGAGIDVTLFQPLADGSMLIEFNSTAGRFYRVEYSSNLTVWKQSLVPIQAGANRVQWIDRGPPYTDAHPSGVEQRFYRVSEIILPD